MFQELELDKFITHSVPFLDINKAFEYMLRGEGLRCMIRMDASGTTWINSTTLFYLPFTLSAERLH